MSSSGLGEKFAAVLVGPDGKPKKTVTYPDLTLGSLNFCPCCGEKLIHVSVEYCTACRHRFLVRMEGKDGKLAPVILDLGAEEK